MVRSAFVTRSLLAAAAALFLPAAPAMAQNFQEPTGATYVPSKSAGEVEGQIVSMDYQRSLLSLQTKSRGKLDILVLPSTNIVDKDNGYASIADLKKGARVKILLSQRASTLNAQIIQLQ
jgi:hypothetical protein